jgi:hypothetical protein
MLKLALMLGAMGAAFFAGGRTIYSALQLQVPFGTAIKMTPDPANIWSWHDTLTLPKNTLTKAFPVMVDFDNNGKMDTELKDVRVMITDMQVSSLNLNANSYDPARFRIHIRNGDGVLWDLSPIHHTSSSYRFGYEAHLATPLSLPVSSTLDIELTSVDSALGNDQAVNVHLIGRLVTL